MLGRLRLFALLALVLLAGVLVTTKVAQAASVTKPAGRAVLAADATHTGLYAKAATEVEIDGTVNGDVIIAASRFVLKGTVNGSVYVAAGDVNISGKVSGNIHVVASNVLMSGTSQSLYLAASHATFDKNSVITGGLVAAASDLDVAGVVGQSSYLAASTVRVDANINGSVTIMASQIELDSSAVVAGNLSYNESAQIRIANDKNIQGSIKKVVSPQPKQSAFVSALAHALYGIVASFILGLVLILLAPRSMVATADYLGSKPASAMLSGLGFMFLAPVALVLVFVTIVGIPLGILGVMAYIGVLMVANVFVALWLGGRLLGKTNTKGLRKQVWALLLGLLVLALCGLLPVFGGLIGLLTAIGGSGALVARNWQRVRHVGGLQRGKQHA